jgi:hypothetical protein
VRDVAKDTSLPRKAHVPFAGEATVLSIPFGIGTSRAEARKRRTRWPEPGRASSTLQLPVGFQVFLRWRKRVVRHAPRQRVGCVAPWSSDQVPWRMESSGGYESRPLPSAGAGGTTVADPLVPSSSIRPEAVQSQPEGRAGALRGERLRRVQGHAPKGVQSDPKICGAGWIPGFLKTGTFPKERPKTEVSRSCGEPGSPGVGPGNGRPKPTPTGQAPRQPLRQRKRAAINRAG